HSRDFIGIETGAIDDDAGAELFALRTDQRQSVSDFGPDHASAGQDVRAVRFGDALERFDQGFGVNNAGVRRIERDGRYDVWFESANEFVIYDLQTFDAVLIAALFQVLKNVEMLFAVGDDQLARAFVRDVVRGAEFIEHRHAAYAVERLERSGLVINPRVD